jgi:hypothetical protein
MTKKQTNAADLENKHFEFDHKTKALKEVKPKRGKKKTYEVPIVYRGLTNFIVEATSKEEAEKIARAKFNDGAAGDDLGNEFEEIEGIGENGIQELEN